MSSTILGIIASSGVAAASFNPLDIANCKLWLDASDTATISLSGSNVTQWNDKTTNGFNLAQGTTAYQPSSGVNTQNGLNVITYGGNDVLFGATASNWNFLHSPTGATIFMALFSDTRASADVLLQTGGSSSVNGIYAERSVSDQISFAVNRGVSGSRVSDFAAGTLTDNQASYFSAVLDNSNATAANRLIYKIKGGSNLSGNTLTNAPSTSTCQNPLNLGAENNTGGGGFFGRICEVIMYSGVLSGTDITSVNSYLGTKWGI
jgi:hypothetical protein